jgi:hypothetical protein
LRFAVAERTVVRLSFFLETDPYMTCYLVLSF